MAMRCYPWFAVRLQRLYLLDARKIVVVNVGPIGCIPYQRETNPSAGTACAEFPNQLAQAFNRRLRALVARRRPPRLALRLRRRLSHLLRHHRQLQIPRYRATRSSLNHNSYGDSDSNLLCSCRAGFEVADSACCYVGERFGGLVPCGPTSRYCADRSKYVFWDPYHPSEAANALIARRILDGGPEDVSPVNVRQLIIT